MLDVSVAKRALGIAIVREAESKPSLHSPAGPSIEAVGASWAIDNPGISEDAPVAARALTTSRRDISKCLLARDKSRPLRTRRHADTHRRFAIMGLVAEQRGDTVTTPASRKYGGCTGFPKKPKPRLEAGAPNDSWIAQSR